MRPCGSRLKHDGKRDSYRLLRGHAEVRPISERPTCGITPAVQTGGRERPKIANNGHSKFDPNRIDHQRIAFVVAGRIAVPARRHVRGMQLVQTSPPPAGREGHAPAAAGIFQDEMVNIQNLSQ